LLNFSPRDQQDDRFDDTGAKIDAAGWHAASLKPSNRAARDPDARRFSEVPPAATCAGPTGASVGSIGLEPAPFGNVRCALRRVSDLALAPVRRNRRL
jgi:hypothetical protein